MEKVTPISACDIDKLVEERKEKKLKEIPSKIIEVVNNLIVENWNVSLNSAIIVQDALVNVLVNEGFNKNEIFNNKWLDFEDLYRQNGWNVYYYKPPYYDPSSPTFTFTKKI